MSSTELSLSPIFGGVRPATGLGAATVVGVAVVATGGWEGVAREICSDATGRQPH